LCGDVGVKGLLAELRSQQPRFADDPAVLSVNLIAALMKIRGRRLGRESVKTKIGEFPRIQGKRNRSCLLWIKNEIKLGVGIDALEFRVTRKRRKTVYGSSHVAVLEGLRYCDAVPYDRAGKRRPWCCSTNAIDGAGAISQSGYDILEGIVKLSKIASLCTDCGDRSRESAVFGIIGISKLLAQTAPHQSED